MLEQMKKCLHSFRQCIEYISAPSSGFFFFNMVQSNRISRKVFGLEDLDTKDGQKKVSVTLLNQKAQGRGSGSKGRYP